MLVVEDAERVARLIQLNLERAGFDVVVIGDATDALTCASDVRPDLLVVDVEMPGSDDLLHALKQHPILRDTPIKTVDRGPLRSLL